jgi:glycosyltransferase involved in cell wall biosynthesis
MSKPTLLELCLSPDLGGLELYMVRAAKALHPHMNVISVINPEGKLEQYYKGTEFPYVLLKKKSNLLMFGAARKLAKIIDEHRIDIVHMHWTKDMPMAVLAKLLSKRKPKLVQTRNMTMTRFKDDFYHRFLYRNVDMMLPVTHQVADQLRTFIPEAVRPEIEVLYMGSDAPEYLDDEKLGALRRELGMEGRFVVGMVGRINEAKGQHLLIRAVASIGDERVHAYFVGHEMKKGYVDSLKQLAADLGISSRVHFLGFMKNPHHFYQACDAVVLASKRETFGLVLIEAMQAGTTVVGSNSGGVVEIIDDNETGLLFESQNAESLAEKISLLAQDTGLNERLAAAGKEKAETKFSNAKQFLKLRDHLCQL